MDTAITSDFPTEAEVMKIEAKSKKAKKAKPKPKAKPSKAKKVAKPAKKAKRPASKKKPGKKKTVKKVSKPKAKKPAAGVVRTERLDLRLSKAEKGKLNAKATKLRRTITSIVLEAIEKIK